MQQCGCFISILAPARGATSGLWYLWPVRPISILAPARGATCTSATTSSCGSSFQFSPLREGRPHVSPNLPVVIRISILAPARGATESTRFLRQGETYFNSRPCERGDRAYHPVQAGQYRFQFSPLREGRPETFAVRLTLVYFNSRPCERGDR